MPPRRRLEGLKQISQYLQLSVNQVRKLYGITVPVEERLPVFTLSFGKGKNLKLYVYVDELDAWMDRRSRQQFNYRDE